MTTLDEFHPAIQQTIKYFANPNLSLEKLATKQGVSKQAVHKQVQKGTSFLLSYGTKQNNVDPKDLQRLETENSRLKSLVTKLQRQLCINSVQISLLKIFQEKIRKFMPNFQVGRLKALEKKHVLDMCAKFTKFGGTIQDFAKLIGRSSATIMAWKKAYAENGIDGLRDKRTVPKNFGNRIPSRIKKQLIALFLRFPRWSEYQYHNYIKFNPGANYYVSMPTIKKLKLLHTEKSKAEKERIKKRWAFAPGTDVWTIDFTCILKTDTYKLQLLTVSDARSRYWFDAVLFLETSTEIVIDHLENLFVKHGKPDIIKADNGPEFRIDCKENLRNLGVYLLNSPTYYGQFCGAHERIHKTLKIYISEFSDHKNLTRLVNEVQTFTEEYNHNMCQEYLGGKTPFEIYGDREFVPPEVETVAPYEKDGELRIKFKNRKNKLARLSEPKI